MMLPFRLAASPIARSTLAGSPYARRLADRHLRRLTELPAIAASFNDNDVNAYRSTAHYTAILDLHAPILLRPRLLKLAGGKLPVGRS